MNERDRETYALLDFYRYRNLVDADNCLKQLSSLTNQDFMSLRNNRTAIDSMIANQDEVDKAPLYFIAENYDHILNTIKGLEVVMFHVSHGEHVMINDVDIESFIIEEDDEEEFEEFTSSLPIRPL